MKNRIHLLFVVPTLALLLTGCGACNKAKQDIQNAKNIAEGYKNIAENLEENLTEQTEKMNARRASGDTTAMNYKDLANYLPDLSGYDRVGEPKGESVNMMGFSHSQTTQKYVDGDKEIEITVIDFAGSYQMYTMAMAFFQSDLMIENDQQITKSEDLGIEDVNAWSEVSKVRDEAKIMIGAGSRFFITIEQKGDKDVLSTAKALPLGDMGAM